MSQDRPDGRAGGEDEDYVPPPYPVQQPARPPPPGQRPVVRPAQPPRRPASHAPRQNDNFPLAVTAVVVLLVLGLGLVFFGLNGNPANTAGTNTGGAPAGVPAAQSTANSPIL